MFTRRIFEWFKSTVPIMSRTEREALDAGTVGWDGELFGRPNWDVLYNIPRLKLSVPEANFINGPVQELCEMLDDYDVCHHRADLPDNIWTFLKEHRFFGIVIPTEYGGLEFSARAHAEIVTMIATRSVTAAVTVMVPNSLGPAELLLHYGTNEEKQKYLPRLAMGEDIPCFALTGPLAGSDAGSIPDVGYVGMGTWEDKSVLGLYLHFDKRYITLAPVATLMGLAIKVQDPHHHLDDLLPDFDDNAITVILMPTELPGIDIGNRHNPLDVAFMNGPIRGKDIFVPLDLVLGGYKNIGKGWQMLVECLSVGRAISLPSLAVAGGKIASAKTGAYARIRKQFNLPIGKFEGIEEKLALIAGYTFIMEAGRDVTLNMIDNDERPSVLSAVTKYHLTEMNREVVNAAMDIQGGSGICLGPKNYIGKLYQSIPISITVEGANILTRNMIIFGQGAVRCHPFVYDEMQTAATNNGEVFNTLFWSHVRYFISNFSHTLYRGLIGSGNTRIRSHDSTECVISTHISNTESHVNRLSTAFAMSTDVALLMFGSRLKRKERISARYGDILSYLYLLSTINIEIQKYPYQSQTIHLFNWAERTLLHKIQEAFYDLFDNFPNKFIGNILRRVVFPYGRVYNRPTDNQDKQVAQILLTPNATRDALISGIFTSSNPTDKSFQLEATFNVMDTYDNMQRNSLDGPLVISDEDKEFLKNIGEQVIELVQVDDFEVV